VLTVNSFVRLLCCIIIFYSSSLLASGEIGKVVFLKGKASLVLNGSIKEIALENNHSISSGDTLQTDNASFVKVILVDGSLLTFGPKTRFLFKSYVYAQNKKREGEFELLYGQVRAKFQKVVEHKDMKNKIKIDTRAVSLGIRGTEVLFNYGQQAGQKGVTQVALLEGKAQVRYKQSGKKFNLRIGKVLVAMTEPSGNMSPYGTYNLPGTTYQALASAGRTSMPDGMALGSSRSGDNEDIENSFLPYETNLDVLKKVSHKMPKRKSRKK